MHEKKQKQNTLHKERSGKIKKKAHVNWQNYFFLAAVFQELIFPSDSVITLSEYAAHQAEKKSLQAECAEYKKRSEKQKQDEKDVDDITARVFSSLVMLSASALRDAGGSVSVT